MSTFHAYEGEGHYTLSVTLESLYAPTATPTASTTVTIEDPIENLNLNTFVCNLNRECLLEYFISRGII